MCTNMALIDVFMAKAAEVKVTDEEGCTADMYLEEVLLLKEL